VSHASGYHNLGRKTNTASGSSLEDNIRLPLVQTDSDGVQLNFQQMALFLGLGRVQHDQDEVGRFRSSNNYEYTTTKVRGDLLDTTWRPRPRPID
jgi:hypothetical protein